MDSSNPLGYFGTPSSIPQVSNTTFTKQVDHNKDLGLLIINSVLFGVVFLILTSALVLLILRKHQQPLKKRSPRLIILSTLGNTLFCLMMMIQSISQYSCSINQDDSQLDQICRAKFTNYMNCFIGLALITICEPLSILPYYLRTVRLYVIFKAQEYYFVNKKKPESWFKYVKEKTLIRICLFVVVILTVISFTLYGIYAFGEKKRLFIYTPSYNLQVCYLNVTNQESQNTSALFSTESPQSYISDPEQNDINLHFNISATMISIIHFLECALLLICIDRLAGIKGDFSIRKELYYVFFVWFLTSYAAQFIQVYTNIYNYYYWLAFILIFRNFSTALITASIPIYQTYLGNSYILLPPSVGSIESLDMVLHIPIASEYFYEYLDTQVDDPEAPIYFSLYADLRYYDKACTEDAGEQIKYEKAVQINEDYLDPNGKYPIVIQKDVKRAIDQKFLNLQQNLNEYLFIELYAFVLDRLREHFERFKRSSDFNKLEDEIGRQEKLYEVLVDASIITN